MKSFNYTHKSLKGIPSYLPQSLLSKTAQKETPLNQRVLRYPILSNSHLDQYKLEKFQEPQIIILKIKTVSKCQHHSINWLQTVQNMNGHLVQIQAPLQEQIQNSGIRIQQLNEGYNRISTMISQNNTASSKFRNSYKYKSAQNSLNASRCNSSKSNIKKVSQKVGQSLKNSREGSPVDYKVLNAI